MLRKGRYVARLGWNAPHKLVLEATDSPESSMLPYICMIIANKPEELQVYRVPWTASHTDLLSGDWVEVAQ